MKNIKDKLTINLFLESGDIITIYFKDLDKCKENSNKIKGTISQRLENALQARSVFIPNDHCLWFEGIKSQVVFCNNNRVREDSHRVRILLDKIVAYSYDSPIFGKESVKL